jgi:hypothetical protein
MAICAGDGSESNLFQAQGGLGHRSEIIRVANVAELSFKKANKLTASSSADRITLAV